MREQYRWSQQDRNGLKHAFAALHRARQHAGARCPENRVGRRYHEVGRCAHSAHACTRLAAPRAVSWVCQLGLSAGEPLPGQRGQKKAARPPATAMPDPTQSPVSGRTPSTAQPHRYESMMKKQP